MFPEKPLISDKVALTTGSKIVGVVSCVPKQIISNDYFTEYLDTGTIEKISKMIGINQRRWIEGVTTTLDLCRFATLDLLKKLDWDPKSIDAIIFVTQTPDYRLPANACILHGELDCATSCVAFDVNLGCSGYPYALWLGMMMIQSGAARRVLLAVGEVGSAGLDLKDQSTAMLFGDAGTATALEADSSAENPAQFLFGADGKGAHHLVAPGSGLRCFLKNNKTISTKNEFYMDGGEIFNFTLQRVPPLIKHILALAKKEIHEFDVFFFHQPNLFMLKHLIKKAKLPVDKVPINIDRFGNTSSASIPLLMTTERKEALQTKSQMIAMFGFGIGYSWAAASLNIGPLTVAETIEV